MPKYVEFQTFREQNFITEASFENVLHWWDKLDANRERKERDHEIGRSAVPLEWGADEMYLSDRPSYDMVLRKLLLAGEFIDIIFDQPETIHELVTDAELSEILKDLKPHLKNMLYYLFLRDYSAVEYAERYDWLVKEFTDLAFTFMTSFLYYLDYDSIHEQTRDLYRQGISAFGGISPTYRIALEKDSPVIVWDFHSLLVMV